MSIYGVYIYIYIYIYIYDRTYDKELFDNFPKNEKLQVNLYSIYTLDSSQEFRIIQLCCTLEN